MKTSRIALALLLLMSTLLALVGSAIFLNYRYADQFHRRLTQGRWPVGSYRYNERTSNFELTPGFSRELLNKAFYLKTHELGYRIPEDADSDSFASGGLLSTGCSFTFGDEVNAEDTFTHLAAEMLGVPGYNYGVCSYSYASSLLQLWDLEKRGTLEKLKPSVIILGAGSWLKGRSRTPFYPTGDIQLAYPYLGEEDGSVRVVRPPDIISVKHATGFATSSSYFENEDTRHVALTLRRRILLMDLIPRALFAKSSKRLFDNPVQVRDLYEFVITSISEIARNNGARFLTLNMPHRAHDRKVDYQLVSVIEECGCTELVDGWESLKKYGALSERLDHPSRTAHLAYAKAIVETIRNPEQP